MSARPHSFVARTEPAEVQLGRPFVYVIEVRHGAEEIYSLPEPLDVGSLALLGVQTERSEVDGEQVTTFRVELANYDQLGELLLPDWELEVQRSDGPATLLVPGATVAVEEIGEGTELVGMQAPLELYVPAWGWAWGLGALLVAIAAVWLWRRRRKRGEGQGSESEIPPEELALRRLGALEAEALWTAGSAKQREHYFRLSEILREYLGRVAPISAQEMTTAELLRALEEAPVPGLSHGWLASWLERGDFVRFAGAAAEPERAEADLVELREVVVAVAAALRAIEDEEERREATS